MYGRVSLCSYCERGGGGLLLNDANHEAVANNGFLVSVEPGSIKYMVFVKNGYRTVCTVVRSGVG
jgi:hypothetical protein